MYGSASDIVALLPSAPPLGMTVCLTCLEFGLVVGRETAPAAIEELPLSDSRSLSGENMFKCDLNAFSNYIVQYSVTSLIQNPKVLTAYRSFVKFEVKYK